MTAPDVERQADPDYRFTLANERTLLAWLRARRGKRNRDARTEYLVEQLRQDATDRSAAASALEPAPAVAALETAEQAANDELKREIAALAERQPDEIATLLRGWLVERS